MEDDKHCICTCVCTCTYARTSTSTSISRKLASCNHHLVAQPIGCPAEWQRKRSARPAPHHRRQAPFDLLLLPAQLRRAGNGRAGDRLRQRAGQIDVRSRDGRTCLAGWPIVGLEESERWRAGELELFTLVVDIVFRPVCHVC